MRQRPFLGLLIAAVAVLALIATGCGSKKSSSNTTSNNTGGGVTALPASSCQTIYQGSAKPDFIIASHNFAGASILMPTLRKPVSIPPRVESASTIA